MKRQHDQAQSTKVRAEGTDPTWSWVCSSLLQDGCQRLPRGPGRAGIRPASVGPCGLHSPFRVPAPPCSWLTGERGSPLGSSYRVIFRLPSWLDYSSLCSALTQEPWGRFCTPSQGGPTCWPHFNPQAGVRCWRASPNHPGVPPQICPPLSDR